MNYVIIVAGGKGKRFSHKIKKQFFKIANRTILEITLQKFISHQLIHRIIIVIPKNENVKIHHKKIFKIVEGGEERKDSVANGLISIINHIKTKDNILIHDGVRPFVSHNLINKIIKELDYNNCVIPGIEIEDTVKEINDNFFVVKTINREKLMRIQTPQGFKAFLLKKFLKTLKENKINFTDESSVFEFIGENVKVIDGEKSNVKITTKEDIMNFSTNIKVGFGFDVHKFVPHRKLILGGVEIPYKLGLEGHSDADVLIHSIIDGILGAAGKSDIGELFPDSCEEYKDINSLILLKKVYDKIKDEYIINNIDVTVVCEEPKLNKFKILMKEKISNILEISEENINIKATTTEKLGFTGRKEGIASYSVVSVIKNL